MSWQLTEEHADADADVTAANREVGTVVGGGGCSNEPRTRPARMFEGLGCRSCGEGNHAEAEVQAGNPEVVKAHVVVVMLGIVLALVLVVFSNPAIGRRRSVG